MRASRGDYTQKKNTHKSIFHWIAAIKTWQLFLVLLLLLAVAAIFLRLNNTQTIEYRQAVLAADERGDIDAVSNALTTLQRHTTDHMNADAIPDVYLEGMYKREIERISRSIRSDRNPNGNVSKKADTICRQRFSGFSRAYVQCVADEQAKFKAQGDLVTKIETPDPALYRYSFSSPLWTPDFAGWTLAVAGLVLLAIIVRIITKIVLYFLVRRQYRSI